MLNVSTYLNLFSILLCLRYIVKLLLNIEHQINVKNKREEIPSQFKDVISLEEHHKSADYTLANAKVAIINLTIETLMLLVWIRFGGLEWLYQTSQKFVDGPILEGLIFFGLFGFVSYLVSLPMSLIQTFVIEEKFGFNNTTFKTYLLDTVKSALLGIILGGLILTLILYPMNKLESWWLLAYFLFMGFQFLLVWAYPKFIAPLFNKFTPLEDAELKNKLQDLQKKTEINFKDYFIMDASRRSTHGNAYFTGFGKNKRIVFFDTLLKDLKADQVIAVLAHELGHLKHKHILKSLIISCVVIFIGFFVLGKLATDANFFMAHGLNEISAHGALLLFSLVAPLYLFFLTPISSYLSRRNEYQADEFAVRHTSADELSDALLKLYKKNSSTLTPGKIYSAFYFSHPTIIERIKSMKSVEKIAH